MEKLNREHSEHRKLWLNHYEYVTPRKPLSASSRCEFYRRAETPLGSRYMVKKEIAVDSNKPYLSTTQLLSACIPPMAQLPGPLSPRQHSGPGRHQAAEKLPSRTEKQLREKSILPAATTHSVTIKWVSLRREKDKQRALSSSAVFIYYALFFSKRTVSKARYTA